MDELKQLINQLTNEQLEIAIEILKKIKDEQEATT